MPSAEVIEGLREHVSLVALQNLFEAVNEDDDAVLDMEEGKQFIKTICNIIQIKEEDKQLAIEQIYLELDSNNNGLFLSLALILVYTKHI